MKKLLAALVAAAIILATNMAQAADLCGLSMSGLTAEIDAKPPGLDAFTGATSTLIDDSDTCQAVQIIGGSAVSIQNGWRVEEILVQVVANDRGTLKSELETLDVQSDKGGTNFVQANWGFCTPMRIEFKRDGTIGSSCGRPAQQFAKIIQGSTGP